MVFALARTIDEALAFKEALGPEAIYGGGLTALQLGWPGEGPGVPVVDVSEVDFGPLSEPAAPGYLRLAANARLEALRLDPLVRERLPALSDLLGKLGAAGVRNLATLGGNLAWGLGDTQVLLAALGADLIYADGARKPVEASMHDDGLIVAVEVHTARHAPHFVEKLGHREAFSPARVVVAGCLRPGGWTVAARIGPTSLLNETLQHADEVETVFSHVEGPDPALMRIARNLLRGHMIRLGDAP
ncbi:FAD binding domain-containing protein [Breoghania sp.]|uniref:FAD binding domain-containing protein n=1 Tax=Breoghania sp. TaxID=2065378 RepID=UPI002AA931E2|nr:FAD binding domain-containing protein [Breoghania sp.]